MSLLRTGACPDVSFARAALGLALSAALLAGGCAGTSGQYGVRDDVASYGYGPSVAGYAQSSEGEIEDDGLPVQAAPPVRIHQAPDDPSQPWSPNYGGTVPSATAPEHAPMSVNEAASSQALDHSSGDDVNRGANEVLPWLQLSGTATAQIQ